MEAPRRYGQATSRAIQGAGPTRGRAGPTAVRQLADWGAQVIKIEGPGGDGGIAGNRHGFDFQNKHRNKRSMVLDLKKPEALAIFYRLVRDADVVVENYRPKVKYRLKVDYDTLKALNPRLVYASISGFGQTGPYHDRPGLDQIAQGMGGLMSINGLPGQGPVRVGIAIADVSAGVFCAMGILIALLEREESGEGQWVQSSLLEAQIGMLDFQAARWLISKQVPAQAGNNHPTSIPTGLFKSSDGLINIQASGHLFPRLCTALGAEHLAKDPDFVTDDVRLKNRDRLNAAIEALTASKTTAEWIEIINAAGVPCGPVYKMDEVFADPQVKHVGIAQPVKHPILGDIELVGQSVTLSRTPSRMRNATPELGEHTDEVLREIGCDDTEIASLRAAGAI